MGPEYMSNQKLQKRERALLGAAIYDCLSNISNIAIAVLVGIVLLSTESHAKTLKVLVADTGINPKAEYRLCRTGHVAFTDDGTVDDNHGHGTNVSYLIDLNAMEAEYCQIICKYHAAGQSGHSNANNLVKCIQHGIDQDVDFINISGGGYDEYETERAAIGKALNKGIVVVVAAGNDGIKLEPFSLFEGCRYYPACYYPQIVVVGSGSGPRNHDKFSNYGSAVDMWVSGVRKCDDQGNCMTGTSQSTAAATGMLISKEYHRRQMLKRMADMAPGPDYKPKAKPR